MLADLLNTDASEYITGFVLATLSHIAYDTDAHSRQHRFTSSGFEELNAVECESAGLTGIEAYVLRHQESIILVFRGSQEAVDYLTDLDLTKAPIDDLLIHRGFARSVLRFMSDFLERRAFYGEISQLWITGHSLGGAIGQVVGYLLSKQGEELVNVTTFGSPRVGGKFLWKNRIDNEGLSERYVRWVNGRDIVPRFPIFGISPQNWIWLHVGRMHTIDRENSSILLNDQQRVRLRRVITSVDDHSISGMSRDDDSGYLRHIYAFMPDADRVVLQNAISGSLKSVFAIQHVIYNYESSNRLSALSTMSPGENTLRKSILVFS